MKTQKEIERLRHVEEAFTQVTEIITETFEGAVEPEMISLVLGMMMASIDATFAIRDGQSWRGLTDPQDIARRLLREGKLGE